MTNTNVSQDFAEDEEEKDFLDIETGEMAEKEEKGKTNSDFITLPASKAVLVKKLLLNIKENNEQLIQILGGFLSREDESRISIGQSVDPSFLRDTDGDEDGGARIIEGVFDGENMIGPDGKVYSVPANYASKSKLVEGDIMKLTITEKGTFVYKQIGPIDRIRVVGILEKDPDSAFYVNNEERRWHVLTASVTYYKGSVGDEVVILVPKNGDSKWAAIENIVHG